MSRIAIAGSVDFYNEEILIQKFDAILKNLTGLKEIVSGEDPGTEEMALRYAEENNIRLNSIPTLRDDIDCKPTSEIGVSEYGKIYWINAGTIPINKLLQA
ncbi:MAG TPA: SLOG family protein [Flavobacterium sp.]|mgnify:CR=1 FL=1|nr:SLOG family protein [Flavobacterium sp.]